MSLSKWLFAPLFLALSSPLFGEDKSSKPTVPLTKTLFLWKWGYEEKPPLPFSDKSPPREQTQGWLLSYQNFGKIFLYIGIDMEKSYSLNKQGDRSSYEGRLGWHLSPLIGLDSYLLIAPFFSYRYDAWKRQKTEEEYYLYEWLSPGYGLSLIAPLSSWLSIGITFKVDEMERGTLEEKKESSPLFFDRIKNAFTIFSSKKSSLKRDTRYSCLVPISFHLKKFPLVELSVVPYWQEFTIEGNHREEAIEQHKGTLREMGVGLSLGTAF